MDTKKSAHQQRKLKQSQSASGRERLVTAARSMFTMRGFANVGINEVIEVAGVARMTLYNNFASKDALVLAVYADLITATLTELPQSNETSEEERVLSFFTHFERKAKHGEDRGCPLIHASLQTPEPRGEIYAQVRSYKQKLRQLILNLLEPTRVHREELADQLLLLLDGAAIEMYLQGISNAGRSARRAATMLLRAEAIGIEPE